MVRVEDPIGIGRLILFLLLIWFTHLFSAFPACTYCAFGIKCAWFQAIQYNTHRVHSYNIDSIEAKRSETEKKGD